jgi:DNA gyrase/topoisomerase IV subunit B
LVEQKVLEKASKGVYYVPELTRFGLTEPGYEEIIRYYTKGEAGMTVGFDLYTRLKLTTQIGKDYQVLSNLLKAKTKNITGVSIEFTDLTFDEKIKKSIEILEVLEHYYEIEDFDRKAFKKFLSSYSKEFDEKILEEVLYKKRYKKRTIAFLSAVLDEKGIKHTLKKFLSGTSKYKIPNKEELHELASA